MSVIRPSRPFVFCCALLCLIALSLLGSATVVAQTQPGTPTLPLQAPGLALTSTEYYIAQVVDERPARTAVAALLVPGAQPNQPAVLRQVELQGGTLAALRQFVAQSLPRNGGRRPLTLRVQECRLTETLTPGQPKYADGNLTLRLVLDWQREGETVVLTEYWGAARYRRALWQTGAAEPALRQGLAEGLRYLHSWVVTQAPTSLKLATGLRLRFTDYRDQTEPDTVFYDPARPLTWADFTAAPRPGPHAAAVFPSFAYAGQPRVVNGILQLDMRLKVFVVRSSSWVSAAARGAYDLNHEQRHFDLVKLVAERFKRRLTPTRMTLKDYDSILQYEYLMAFQEMNRVQEQYDGETQHGINEAEQERWNQRIEAELSQYGVARRTETLAPLAPRLPK
ncbi:hypothetical protein [Hymenobacter cellulosivorans]|uniref:Uncharacterized protein n=1 Tax=Hymenobacter cellulosivorans TaxID=2932249 RepID=A0ABY4F4G7_9BACT|nr:hypothetical protein [Hymenobacter cellulosivorans]UOQ50819.1 hypothetical protein MUN80_13730 [Hymenobacter cellulosivorans]